MVGGEWQEKWSLASAKVLVRQTHASDMRYLRYDIYDYTDACHTQFSPKRTSLQLRVPLLGMFFISYSTYIHIQGPLSLETLSEGPCPDTCLAFRAIWFVGCRFERFSWELTTTYNRG